MTHLDHNRVDGQCFVIFVIEQVSYHDDNYNKSNIAFLLFNEDNVVQGPLCITKENGNKQIVFSKNDYSSHEDMYIYMTWLNDNSNFFSIF